MKGGPEEAGSTSPVGVLLLNLGGPDSLKAVRPFLYNLFSDRDIIRLGPVFLQKPIAYLISTFRRRKTESYYTLIGGKSPILEITTAQAEALEKVLCVQVPGTPVQSDAKGTGRRDWQVYIGMRYWHPFIDDAVERIYKAGVRRLVVLSLYPQYSVATSGSSLTRLQKVLERYPMEIITISSWFDHPSYIAAMTENIKKGFAVFGSGDGRDVRVLFSAHSLPVKFIEEGDPYVDQIKGTIHAIERQLAIRWSLSYQSKSGPVEWLSPSTEETLESLAKEGVKNVLVVPISFVSDHIETLYEIDILYTDMAKRLGLRLERMESLNISPLFITALRDIILEGIQEGGWTGL